MGDQVIKIIISASDLSYDSLLNRFGNHTGNIISASDLSYDSLLNRFGNHTGNIISAYSCIKLCHKDYTQTI